MYRIPVIPLLCVATEAFEPDNRLAAWAQQPPTASAKKLAPVPADQAKNDRLYLRRVDGKGVATLDPVKDLQKDDKTIHATLRVYDEKAAERDRVQFQVGSVVLEPWIASHRDAIDPRAKRVPEIGVAVLFVIRDTAVNRKTLFKMPTVVSCSDAQGFKHRVLRHHAPKLTDEKSDAFGPKFARIDGLTIRTLFITERLGKEPGDLVVTVDTEQALVDHPQREPGAFWHNRFHLKLPKEEIEKAAK